MQAVEHIRRDALPPGSRLRDYTLEAVIGSGGFGIVYRARHAELGHLVAIKEYFPAELAVRVDADVRVRNELNGELYLDGLQRFREEARALIEFDKHPSIVSCRGFFWLNNTAYLVMEYEEGLSLAQLLRQREAEGRPFCEEDLVRVAVPLLEGLERVHEAGMLHRDIKPANILIHRHDERPVLIDFGAAKAGLAGSSKSLAPYTEGYAAPEQVADGDLGPWTDLYGVGATLWRMVAGGAETGPADPAKVEQRQYALSRGKEDPLQRARELGAGRFSPGLLEAIDRCLRLPESQRMRSCRQLLLTLRHAGEKKSQEAVAEQSVPPTAVEGPRKLRPPRRSWMPVAFGFSVIGVVVLVVWSLFAWLLSVNRGPSPESSLIPFRVETVPANASVQLVDRPEEYRREMPLPAGSYNLAISARGYRSKRATVQHGLGLPVQGFRLERIPAPPLTGIPELEAYVAAWKQENGAEEKVAIARRRLVAELGREQESRERESQAQAEADRERLEREAQAERERRERIRAEESRKRLEAERRPPGTLWRDNALGMEFVWIPAGSFRMGSTASEADTDERPVREVRISSGFWMGKYEVTQAQWERVMGSNPSSFTSCGSRCPVEDVSWHETSEFIGKFNALDAGRRNRYRLPTEAEWEYAARGGRKTGERHGPVDRIAWYGANSAGTTHRVGSKASNGYLLHDMLGNVSEWVEDRYGTYVDQAETDPKGPNAGPNRIHRGGNWFLDARYLRSSARDYDSPANKHNTLGLRLVRVE